MVRYLALLAVAAGAAWVLYQFDPVTAGFYPACPFLTLTGFQCPGCGTTRALHALLHGQVGDAFRLNPLLFAALGAGIAFLIRPSLMTRPATAWLSAVVVIGWGLLRNV